MEETDVLDDWGDKVPPAPKFRRLKRNQEENEDMIKYLDKRIEKVSQ